MKEIYTERTLQRDGGGGRAVVSFTITMSIARNVIVVVIRGVPSFFQQYLCLLNLSQIGQLTLPMASS